MTTITVENAQENLGEIVARAARGEEFLLVGHEGGVSAKLVAVPDPPPTPSPKGPRIIGRGLFGPIPDDIDEPVPGFEEYM